MDNQESKTDTEARPLAVPPPPTGSEDDMAGIMALVQIREIVGDPHGKLMQDELVQRVRNLREAENKLRDGVIQFVKEEEWSDAEIDRLKFILDETQWWDWDDTPNVERRHPTNDSK